MRTNTGINDHPVSVAYIAAILARQIFGDLSRKTVQLVGAGEMITLCGHHFRQKAVGGLRIANRSLERAESLGAELQDIIKNNSTNTITYILLDFLLIIV